MPSQGTSPSELTCLAGSTTTASVPTLSFTASVGDIILYVGSGNWYTSYTGMDVLIPNTVGGASQIYTAIFKATSTSCTVTGVGKIHAVYRMS